MNPEPNHDTVIVVRDLMKQFNGSRAVTDVSLSVRRGEIFGILGPNGAGKTTTVECIAGTLKPDAGHVRVLSLDPAADRVQVRERIGYQLQAAALPASIRVEEALRLYASFYASPANVSDLLREVGLIPHRKRPFAKLSGGQKQRLSIALAFIGRPQVVVLDEMTTGVDPEGRREVWRLVKRLKEHDTTFVLVSHDLDEVDRLCDRFAIIATGRTRFIGTAAELKGRMALTKIEALLFLRNPTSMFMALLLPTGILLLQGTVIPGTRDPVSGNPELRVIDLFLPVAIAIALTSVAITNYPSTIGAYRESGVLRRLGVTPIGPARVLIAQWVISGASFIIAATLTVGVAWVC
jgi:ABC-2 type transport system ATP-binding protein